ncbi:hypothetical protein [Burkholderia sp. Bp9143]|uniref:hypothetical protein n=1 Tax=Burkholderia sp. Bp9143 TaxID=2184574 RepID=UPI0021AB75E7|nr:hypothetical protein [Burkholderia sp. Bp9143]
MSVSSSAIASPIASHASTSMPACRLATAFTTVIVNASKTGSVPSNQTTRAGDGRPNATHRPPAASVTAERTSNTRSIDQRIRDMTIFPLAVHERVRCVRFRLLTAWHQSRKRRVSSVDVGQDDAPAATCRRGALLDVSQAAGRFRQQNRNVTPDGLEPISC